jgi:hypothetical protein
MVQKEVRLGSLFFIFAFLIPLFRIFFFSCLSYLTFLVVLSNARGTKFVVGNFFESSYFSVYTKEMNM